MAPPSSSSAPPAPLDWEREGRRIHRKSIVLAGALGAMVLLACVLHDHMVWVHCGRPGEEDEIDAQLPWLPPALHASQHLRGPQQSLLVNTTTSTKSTSIDPTRPCPGSWVVGRAIDEAAAAQAEAAAAAWRLNLTSQLRDMYDEASGMHHHGDPTTEPAAWARFDVFMGVGSVAAANANVVCPSLRRVGGDGDGGKLVCGLEFLPDDDGSCVVYSLGSNNEWDFEADIVAATRHCQVHTFDCKMAEPLVPPELKGRVVFHKLCLGTGGVEDDGQMFATFPEIMARLGHDRVTLLKADIEGYEYDLFDQLLDPARGGFPDPSALPEQIVAELHWTTPMEGLDWHGRQRTAGELAVLALRLHDRGYRLVSREDNPLCEHCAEVTLVRFRCGA